MPTLAQMEAATPKCPAVTKATNLSPGSRCGQPCRYDAGLNLWRCPFHGDVWTGEALGALLNDDAAAEAA